MERLIVSATLHSFSQRVHVARQFEYSWHEIAKRMDYWKGQERSVPCKLIANTSRISHDRSWSWQAYHCGIAFGFE